MDFFKILLLCFMLLVVDGSPIAIKDSDLTTSLIDVSKTLNKIQLGKCTDINATVPFNEIKPELPPPSDELSLKHVVLGRGTQNYTCSCSEKTAKPVAKGALATLFDTSCLAGHYPNLLHELPAALSNVSVDTLTFLAVLTGQIVSPESGELISGKHFFNSEGVPFFDFSLGGFKDWMNAKSDASTPAPVRSNGSGNDVPWLKLVSTDGSGVKVSIVFVPGIYII